MQASWLTTHPRSIEQAIRQRGSTPVGSVGEDPLSSSVSPVNSIFRFSGIAPSVAANSAATRITATRPHAIRTVSRACL